VSEVEPDVDVAIVGAGLAGLACALHVTRAGRSVVLLEASDRVGGRVRSDRVDGFTLDRGFQVHDTAYPELQRLLDPVPLDFGAFVRGAQVHVGGRLHLLADPRRHPGAALSSLRAPVGSLRDKLALARYATRAAYGDARGIKRGPDVAAAQSFRDAHLGAGIVEGFLRPYLSGVFLERELTTSARFAQLVLRCQVRGEQVLPRDGIGAIPAQLADRLPAGALRLASPVEQVRAGEVLVAGARLHARAVVVAADPRTAERLIGPQLGVTPVNGVTTWYHVAAADPLGGRAVLCLEGEGRAAGPLANSVCLTAAVPSYSPSGRHLVSSSVVHPSTASEADVRAQLRRWHGPQVDGWELLARYDIPEALPSMAAPLGHLRKQARLRPGLFVCGDARATASTQGATVSGRHAAEEVLAELA